jgi:serine/threonine protein phosphatase PrpC
MSAAATKTSADAPWTLSSSARTHIGLVRTVNEDRLLNRADRGLFAIADGMGGHSRGDVAADLVIQALSLLATSAENITAEGLCKTMCGANERVYSLDPRRAGQSGSTIAGMHIAEGQVFMFWAGDSRIYRLRQGRLQPLTRDHRVVQEMIDAGVLTEETARAHPRASVITRAVGARPDLSLAFAHDLAEHGDAYLLCSDGLTDLVEAQPISRMLGLSAERAADALLEAAIRAGGRDNISLIVVGVAQMDHGLSNAARETSQTWVRVN